VGDAVTLFTEVALGVGSGSISGSRRIIVLGAAACVVPVVFILRGFVDSLCPLVLIGRQTWAAGHPHPYSVSKLLVFLSLRVSTCCKILITKRFPAESSWIRSYVEFFASFGSFRLKGGAKRMYRDNDLKEDFSGSLCMKWEK
jgi:hypothetical protein